MLEIFTKDSPEQNMLEIFIEYIRLSWGGRIATEKKQHSHGICRDGCLMVVYYIGGFCVDYE